MYMCRAVCGCNGGFDLFICARDVCISSQCAASLPFTLRNMAPKTGPFVRAECPRCFATLALNEHRTPRCVTAAHLDAVSKEWSCEEHIVFGFNLMSYCKPCNAAKPHPGQTHHDIAPKSRSSANGRWKCYMRQ